MRSIYIAKGSPLLPPAFASIFDDSASSSLDVFFDPSYGLTNLPGLTLGNFSAFFCFFLFWFLVFHPFFNTSMFINHFGGYF